MLNPAKSILTAVGSEGDSPHLADALAICRSVGAEITVVVIDVAVPSLVSNYGSANAIMRSESYLHGEEAVTQQAERVEKQLDEAGVKGVVVPAYLLGSEVERVVAEQAMFADLTVLPSKLPITTAVYRHVFNAAVFAAGSPLLLLPEGGTVFPASEHTMIAWDAGVQSARAVRHTVSRLAQANRVTSVTIDAAPRHGGMDAGLIRYLQQHEVKLAVQDKTSGSRTVGQTIRDTASEIGADLIVMGAYGHSRVREFIIGGATREIIEHATVPVLMVH